MVTVSEDNEMAARLLSNSPSPTPAAGRAPAPALHAHSAAGASASPSPSRGSREYSAFDAEPARPDGSPASGHRRATNVAGSPDPRAPAARLARLARRLASLVSLSTGALALPLRRATRTAHSTGRALGGRRRRSARESWATGIGVAPARALSPPVARGGADRVEGRPRGRSGGSEGTRT